MRVSVIMRSERHSCRTNRFELMWDLLLTLPCLFLLVLTFGTKKRRSTARKPFSTDGDEMIPFSVFVGSPRGVSSVESMKAQGSSIRSSIKWREEGGGVVRTQQIVGSIADTLDPVNHCRTEVSTARTKMSEFSEQNLEIRTR